MNITYDPEADASYISVVDDIADGESAATIHSITTPEDRGEIILDFDAQGYLLGIEVLFASKVLEASLIADAPGPSLTARMASRAHRDGAALTITYDPKINFAYIVLVDYMADAKIAQSISSIMTPGDRGEIGLDFDSSGCLLGVEVQFANSAIRPSVLAAAFPPGLR